MHKSGSATGLYSRNHKTRKHLKTHQSPSYLCPAHLRLDLQPEPGVHEVLHACLVKCNKRPARSSIKILKFESGVQYLHAIDMYTYVCIILQIILKLTSLMAVPSQMQSWQKAEVLMHSNGKSLFTRIDKLLFGDSLVQKPASTKSSRTQYATLSLSNQCPFRQTTCAGL